MSDKAAAAQKWAEAKSCLDAADLALTAAKEAYAKAEDAEFHAWQALEALAGRVAPKPEPVSVMAAFEQGLAAQQAQGQMLQQNPYRHSLQTNPIG